MADESQRNRRGATDTAAKAVKWGLRARWLLGCTGCGSLLTGCLWALLIIFGLILFVVLLYYLCHEFLGGAGGWVEGLLARFGLSPGICNLLR